MWYFVSFFGGCVFGVLGLYAIMRLIVWEDDRALKKQREQNELATTQETV